MVPTLIVQNHRTKVLAVVIAAALVLSILAQAVPVRAGTVNLYGSGDCSGLGASFHLTSPPKAYTAQSGCYLSYLDSAAKDGGGTWHWASPWVSVPALSQITHNWNGAIGVYGAHQVCDGYWSGCSSLSYTASGNVSGFPGF